MLACRHVGPAACEPCVIPPSQLALELPRACLSGVSTLNTEPCTQQIQTTLFSCYAHGVTCMYPPPHMTCACFLRRLCFHAMRMLPRDRRRPSGARCENEIDGTDATDAWCMHGVVTALRTCMHPPPHMTCMVWLPHFALACILLLTCMYLAALGSTGF